MIKRLQENTFQSNKSQKRDVFEMDHNELINYLKENNILSNNEIIILKQERKDGIVLSGRYLNRAVDTYNRKFSEEKKPTAAFDAMVNFLDLLIGNQLVSIGIGCWLEKKFSLSLSTPTELRGKELKDFISRQQIEEQPNNFAKQGLFFKETVSRDAQLKIYLSAIIRQYISCILDLKRSKDDPMVEIKGPVGSGKTHFLLNALHEITRKIENNFKQFALEEFEKMWTFSSIKTIPTNWLQDFVNILKSSIKVFASQRSGFSWKTHFGNLSARQYVAAILAIQHLAPKGKVFNAENFKQTPLNLHDVVDLIIDKYQTRMLCIEINIDEVQLLIDDSERRNTSAHSLIETMVGIGSERHDILFLTTVGGTTFPANKEGALQNINFASLSCASNYIIELGTLNIKHTLDLLKNENQEQLQQLESKIPLEKLVNLLSLIGPFPRTVEMLIKSIIHCKSEMTVNTLYQSVKNMLVVKYSEQKESMISHDYKEVAKILRCILESKIVIMDKTVTNALIRGLISYHKNGCLAVIFIYLHIALCENSIIKEKLQCSFFDTYVTALLEGTENSNTIEELIPKFIIFKSRVYQTIDEMKINASVFFKGAHLGNKVKGLILDLNNEMSFYRSLNSIDTALTNVSNINVKNGSNPIDMTRNPIALLVGNVWPSGDGIISFNSKQFLVFETKKQEYTSLRGINTNDSFEHEQQQFNAFVEKGNIPKPVLFLYCNAGSTNTKEKGADVFLDVANDYSILVERSNWERFFNIIPRIYISKTDRKKLGNDPSSFEPQITIVQMSTTDSYSQEEMDALDLFCNSQ